METPRRVSEEAEVQYPGIPPYRVHLTTPFIEFKRGEINQSIVERFERHAQKYPSRVAVKTRVCQLTYAELNQSANRLARAIVGQHDRERKPVALLMDQGASLIVAVLAVLKTGRPYVALDTSFPPSRNAWMVDDSQSGLILTDNRHCLAAKTLVNDASQVVNVDAIGSQFSSENPNLSISPEAIAYILYTSGSTGWPKGVLQSHRNVLHNIMKYTNGLHISVDDRLTLLYSCSFGASVSDIFGALLNGAALLPFNLREEGMIMLKKWLIEEEISVYHSVPTVYRSLIASLTGREKFPSLRLIKLGGETVRKRDWELYKQYFHEGCIFHVGLGSTEMNIIRQFFCDKRTSINSSIVPVGYEVDDTEVILLDDDGREVGTNQIGEIVIRSPYLALGYQRLGKMTNAVSLPDIPAGDSRIYKTGDIGYMLPGGCLLHIGRKDLQAKIRGYRIQVNEIEAAIVGLSYIKEAVVVASENTRGDNQLIAYIIPYDGEMPSSTQIRQALKDKLPDYMMPSRFIFLETLPYTANGKIDRNALFSLNIERREPGENFVAPVSPVEKRLTEIWADMLGLDTVGTKDSFFDLGGDSIMAISMSIQIEEEFGKEIPPSALFQSSSVSQLASLIENGWESQPLRGLIPLKDGSSAFPLILIAPVAFDLLVYRHLINRLKTEQSIYGIVGTEEIFLSTVEETASRYVDQILSRFPEGSFVLAGFSSGGIMAFEIALQLHAMNIKVPFLAMFDSTCPFYLNKNIHWWRPVIMSEFLMNLPFWFYYYLTDKTYVRTFITNRIRNKLNLPTINESQNLRYQFQDLMKKTSGWLRSYHPRYFPGRIVYYKAKGQGFFRPLIRDKGWREFAARIDVHRVAGTHVQIMQEPYVRVLAEKMDAELQSTYCAD